MSMEVYSRSFLFRAAVHSFVSRGILLGLNKWGHLLRVYEKGLNSPLQIRIVIK
jgi:hypothetical protein